MFSRTPLLLYHREAVIRYTRTSDAEAGPGGVLNAALFDDVSVCRLLVIVVTFVRCLS